MNNKFFIEIISKDIFNKMYKKSYKENCTIPIDELRLIHILHKDINRNIKEGEMVLNKNIATIVLNIFEKLYEESYPIEKVKLIDEYDADDELSMEDNNSSSFNFRFISHTNKVSKHGLGVAIDINPLYNPYYKVVEEKEVLEPINSRMYLDRTKEFPYKINKGDLCYNLFTSNGFIWGGDWTDRKDYQHFELSNEAINKLYPNKN